MRVGCIHTTIHNTAAAPGLLVCPAGAARLQPSIPGWVKLAGKVVLAASRSYQATNHRRLAHLAQALAIYCQGRPGDRLVSHNQAVILKMRVTAMESWLALQPYYGAILISHGHRNPASRRHSQQLA